MKTKQHSFKTKTILPKSEVLYPKQRGDLAVARVVRGINLDFYIHLNQNRKSESILYI